MNLLLRLLWLLLRSHSRGDLDPLVEHGELSMLVWPNDLDVLGHVNNGRFLSLMDLGRLDFLMRAGLWVPARRRKWFPLVGAVQIEYRRPLKTFQRYTLLTRLLSWDERWFYLEQCFQRGESRIVTATVKAMIYGPSGAVSTRDVLAVIGIDAPPPPLPTEIAALVQARPKA